MSRSNTKKIHLVMYVPVTAPPVLEFGMVNIRFRGKANGLPGTRALLAGTGTVCNEPPCKDRSAGPHSCSLSNRLSLSFGGGVSGFIQRHKRVRGMYPLLT